MKLIRTSVWAILAAAILIVPVGIFALQQQQAYAPRDCPSCIPDFKKLTHEFEKDVINIIGDPNEDPVPHLRPLLEAYEQEVMRIFLGGPDTIPVLLEDYELAVFRVVFDALPEPDKQQQHELIKDFKQLTHDFVHTVSLLNLPLPQPG